MSEIKLPESFNDSDGFEYKLVERQGDLAIYTQNKFNRVVSWEVVKIRHLPERTFPGGKSRGASEAYPKPSDWGKSAWTCASLERAQERLKGLQELVRTLPNTTDSTHSGSLPQTEAGAP